MSTVLERMALPARLRFAPGSPLAVACWTIISPNCLTDQNIRSGQGKTAPRSPIV
jgi:hypothetical protein